ncbi:MAG TPA: carbon-nitrogen hydrolase, partial [Planctomycetaceae bacterium]|nr:carbon-nitrogen hydrolase [Planctomycetaceae bacterium]
MDSIDLKEYEWNIKVRPLTMEDFDDLIEMQKRCFPGMQPWQRDQIESQLKHFPEGQICIEIDGKLAASSCSLILEYDPDMAWHDWKKVADNGYIRNHDPKG